MKKIFDCFLFFLLLVALLFLGKGIIESLSVISLNRKTAATITSWYVHEINPSKFAVAASYEFNVGNQIFYGETLFQKAYYLNRFAAEGAMKEMEKRKWSAWYRNVNPNHSALQKIFPFKNLIRGFIASLVAIYFYCMKWTWFQRSSNMLD